MKFRIRKPRLRMNKKGKISLSGGGASFGDKNSRINISKSGVNSTVGADGKSYNTNRGWNCGFIMLFALGVGTMALGSTIYLIVT